MCKAMCILHIIFETPGYRLNKSIEIKKINIECKNTKNVKNGLEMYRCIDLFNDIAKLFLTSRQGR